MSLQIETFSALAVGLAIGLLVGFMYSSRLYKNTVKSIVEAFLASDYNDQSEDFSDISQFIDRFNLNEEKKKNEFGDGR